LGAERIDIGSDGSWTLRICRQWGGGDYIDLANGVGGLKSIEMFCNLFGIVYNFVVFI
jgi:hypothetical protein